MTAVLSWASEWTVLIVLFAVFSTFGFLLGVTCRHCFEEAMDGWRATRALKSRFWVSKVWGPFACGFLAGCALRHPYEGRGITAMLGWANEWTVLIALGAVFSTFGLLLGFRCRDCFDFEKCMDRWRAAQAVKSRFWFSKVWGPFAYGFLAVFLIGHWKG